MQVALNGLPGITYDLRLSYLPRRHHLSGPYLPPCTQPECAKSHNECLPPRGSLFPTACRHLQGVCLRLENLSGRQNLVLAMIKVLGFRVSERKSPPWLVGSRLEMLR